MKNCFATTIPERLLSLYPGAEIFKTEALMEKQAKENLFVPHTTAGKTKPCALLIQTYIPITK